MGSVGPWGAGRRSSWRSASCRISSGQRFCGQLASRALSCRVPACRHSLSALPAGGHLSGGRSAAAEAGFTLIEAIVALAVLAVLLAALLTGLGQSWRGIGQAEQDGRAMALAKARLAVIGREVPLGEGRLAAGENSGISWTVTGERYMQGDERDGSGRLPLPQAFWLVFDASWQDGTQLRQRSLRVRSLRLGEP